MSVLTPDDAENTEAAVSRPSIHPGEILTDELEETGITATGLARQLKVPRNRISQIVKGKRAITGGTALRLGHWFGDSAEFWLNLRASFDLRMAAVAAGAEIEALPVRRPAGTGHFSSQTSSNRQPL